MTVLMLCWEFPPFITGGLGIACYGIVKALLKRGIKIYLFLPADFPLYFSLEKPEDADNLEPVFFLKRDEINFRIKKLLSYKDKFIYLGLKQDSDTYLYNDKLFKRVNNFTKMVSGFARTLKFDIVHAHDWLTFPAALFLKQKINRPFIAHIHSTEYDRSCGKVNDTIVKIERTGLLAVDTIVTVSNYAKSIIAEKYGINKSRIHVAYNACSLTRADRAGTSAPKKQAVIFLGRLTAQKGPQYFLDTAGKVLKKFPEVKFIVAGDGDYRGELVKRAEESGIQNSVLFTGFLERDEVANYLSISDILLLPSVSEPFGIAVLEAMKFGLAVITSKNAGVTEIADSIYKVDFRDTDTMASIIIELLNNPKLLRKRVVNGKEEIKKISWDLTAERIVELYLDITKSL